MNCSRVNQSVYPVNLTGNLDEIAAVHRKQKKRHPADTDNDTENKRIADDSYQFLRITDILQIQIPRFDEY